MVNKGIAICNSWLWLQNTWTVCLSPVKETSQLPNEKNAKFDRFYEVYSHNKKISQLLTSITWQIINSWKRKMYEKIKKETIFFLQLLTLIAECMNSMPQFKKGNEPIAKWEGMSYLNGFMKKSIVVIKKFYNCWRICDITRQIINSWKRKKLMEK